MLTINIRGLNSTKLDLVASHVRKLNVDVCSIQETQVSSEKSIQSLSSQWDGCSFWSLAFGHQGGVAVLFSLFF